MDRRMIFGLAVGLVVLGASISEARAGQTSLPSDLATLETAGNYAVVGNLEFSDFTYTTSPLGSPPSASAVTVSAFTSVPGSPGITFNGAFSAAANSIVDYAITYQVTTTDGSSISAALLSLGGFTNEGGNGSVAIGETILDTHGDVISKVPFSVYTPGQTSDMTLLLPPETTIIVEKDITVYGGTVDNTVATFSFVDQGFSTSQGVPTGSVPEPGSMALLGIGLSGLLTFRRLIRRRRA